MFETTNHFHLALRIHSESKMIQGARCKSRPLSVSLGDPWRALVLPQAKQNTCRTGEITHEMTTWTTWG